MNEIRKSEQRIEKQNERNWMNKSLKIEQIKQMNSNQYRQCNITVVIGPMIGKCFYVQISSSLTMYNLIKQTNKTKKTTCG